MSDSPAPAGPILSAEHLTVNRGRREVIHDLSIALNDGEVVALLGPNGAGKSTLLDALTGALEPAQGRIERRGRVAIALQSPDLARRSVLANVILALAWWGVPRDQRRGRAQEALRAIAAEHLSPRPAASLSGGERRRVHLARTLAVQPDVLLLDEPFAGLDSGTRAGLLDDTGAALRASARAALVVVHDRAEAWALADRLVIMLDGRLVADGQPRELLERPPTIDVARFLGFDGTLEQPRGRLLLTRPQHVRLDPSGPVRATATRVIPVEDGVRLELTSADGRLFALSPLPGPAKGETVNLRITGGVRFDRAAGDQPDPTVDRAPAHSRNP